MKTDSPLILIVEDNPADFALISEELATAVDRGVFRLANAASLADACSQLDAEDVAAVLLDLSLPDSLGIETFDEVLKHSPNTPIVVLTGLDDSELGLRAVRNGAQDYLVKGKIDGTSLERTLHYAVERKRRETALRQKQSLEVMAQFAGGIATEFNHLLQVVLGRLQALEWPLRDQPELLKEVHAASRTVLNGADLTRRLLSVTGRMPEAPALLNVNAHIDKLCESLRKSFGKDTSIRAELCETSWPVFADAAQLDMTILNIVNNSREAMLGRGAITISTSNMSIPAGNPAELPAGDYLLIEITDIGEGLSASARKNMFDPFFSTRGNSRLNGLGLNMTQNFVRANGGHVGVRSERGQGTTVTLYLPRAEGSMEDVAGAADQFIPEQRSARILVLESDADLRHAFSRYLWQLGYPTFEASAAADALALMDGGDEIAAVIIDRRGISGIPGEVLVRKLRQLNPELRVLFLGDVPMEPQIDSELPEHAVASLATPCTIAEFSDQVHQLLKATRNAA
jgi:two-component system, cell cycle sensor histidine kinase and response regulator CckA